MPGFEIFGEEERKEVQDVLETGVLFRYGFDGARNGHWKAREFEQTLCQKLDVAHCHLVSSGTSALTTALAACGIGAGDEVILPPFTFVATFESVLSVGAVPVFADIDQTLCLDPEAVEKKISEKTKAICPVHMCGAMARIDRLKALCEEKGLILVEDACQSVGASFQGRALGTFGLAGCFSFDPVKTITCGEGGAVITNDQEVYTRCDQFADHGHDHVGMDRGAETHPIMGANFRISELNAAVGLAQLRKLDQMIETQRKNKKVLKDCLAQVPEISFRVLPDPDGDSGTFLSFFLPDEQRAREAAAELGKAGVDGCFYYLDNNWHYIRKWDHLKKRVSASRSVLDFYKDVPDYAAQDFSASDAVIGRNISMLIKLSWTEKDLETRVENMRKVFGI